MALETDSIVELEARRRPALIDVDKAALTELLSDALIWTHETGVVVSKAAMSRRSALGRASSA